MNSNENLVRQYIREMLITERVSRDSVFRRGQETSTHEVADVLGWIRSMKDMFLHFFNAIKGLIYTGTAAYKGAEAVFKIGAEGMKSVVGGTQPDYDSIITNQATTMRKMRDFTGVDKLQTLGKGLGLRNEGRFIDSCLRERSLLFLLESNEEDAVVDQIVDQAVQDASAEMAQETAAIPEVPVEIPPPTIDPMHADKVAIEMGRAAHADVSNMMGMYNQAMNADSLPALVSALPPTLPPTRGNPAQPNEFTLESLAQKASAREGKEITQEDAEAGSQDLMIKLKRLLPQAFIGALAGSLDRVLTDISSEPSPVQDAIRNSVMIPYEQALSQLKS